MQAVVQTEVDGRTLTVDDELTSAIAIIRRQEGRVVSRLKDRSRQERETSLRMLVASGLAQPESWAQEVDLAAEEFVGRCIALRGPFTEGQQRRDLRERARIYKLLTANDVTIPVTTDAHRNLWDRLLLDEPFVFPDQKTSDYRTDYIPFTGCTNDPTRLLPGQEAVAEAMIEQETASLLAFINRDALDCELRATAGYFLHCRIHPFYEGNGRTGRALTCLVRGDTYSVATKLSYIRVLQQNRVQISTIIRATVANRKDLRLCVNTMLDLLAKAQRA